MSALVKVAPLAVELKYALSKDLIGSLNSTVASFKSLVVTATGCGASVSSATVNSISTGAIFNPEKSSTLLITSL
ncbi:hypothetical protein D3C81_1664070 [compost metagenome]